MTFWRKLRPFLTRAEKRRVADAIARAERGTTGEIHVHLSTLSSPRGVLEQAQRLFLELGLDKTKERNGVLILLATGDRRFAVWGDSGIHQAAGQPLWDGARAALEAGLRAGKPCEAIEAAIAAVGRALAAHFPSDGGGPNELPDAVTER